jgi:phosphoribosylformylglycinamidine synthase
MKFKATVYAKLRSSVSDAAGNAVMNNVKRIAPSFDVSLLRIGKCIDMWFEAPDRETAEKELKILSDQMLANVVIEDWSFEVVETEEVGLGEVSNPRA